MRDSNPQVTLGSPPAGCENGGEKLNGAIHDEKLAGQRRSASLAALSEALSDGAELRVPAPVTEVTKRNAQGHGRLPILPAEAFELARQVYYLQHGNIRDCARAIIAAGLSDTDNLVTVSERLQSWWHREDWPKRDMRQLVTIRDANHDGGLYRGRVCAGKTTGSGPAPEGKACTATALPDSDFCWQHDPRPEYEARRASTGQRLHQSRTKDMVPIEPFIEWTEAKRVELLERAKASGRRLDPKARGYKLLAVWLGVDQSTLQRLKDKGTSQTRGAPTTAGRIRASTIVSYLDGTGVSFHDVYGYDPPAQRDLTHYTCPNCGGAKNHESKVCRACYDADRGVQCTYVGKYSGTRCRQRTKDPSGLCHKCRRTVQRIPTPRTGRKSAVTDPMLLLALDEFRRFPAHAWVAAKMWACDAGGCRDVFAHQASLTGSIAYRFLAVGLTVVTRGKEAAPVWDEVERRYAELVDAHGAPEWPPLDRPLEAATLPVGPFAAWLRARFEEIGGRHGGGYKRLCGEYGRAYAHEQRPVVLRTVVDRALEKWGDGTTFQDLYGGGA